MFNALMGPPTFSPFDGVFLPATAIYVAYNAHKYPPNPETFFDLKSINYFSLPTIALYGVEATIFYAADYSIASTLAAMTTSTLGATTISLLTPVCLGGLAYFAWKCGPSHDVITQKLTSAVQGTRQAASYISEGVGKLCERFGWCRRRPSQAASPKVKQEMKMPEQTKAHVIKIAADDVETQHVASPEEQGYRRLPG